jgi:hypothetical protein
MDGKLFDRITKSLVDIAPRREAIKALAGGGLAAIAARIGAVEADAKNKHKKKKKKRKNATQPAPVPAPQACIERRRTCGAGVKCCNQDVGQTACRTFPTATCASLTGLHCCGLEGADCDNTLGINNCDCCDGLFCGGTEGFGRCQEQPA